jgi:sugar O-acyltransferase (sialic acid O-acetyltransferase NeuD family)
MEKILIFGNSQLAEVISYYINKDSKYEIYGYVVDDEFIKNTNFFLKKPLIPFSSLNDNNYSVKEYKFLVAIGYSNMNIIRKEKYEKIKKLGYGFVSYLNSQSQIHTKTIGENCIILENNTIQPFVKIGNNCIIWSGNHIGHHSEISDHCFISSHVVISGNVKINERCFFGVNTSLADSITVGVANFFSPNSCIKKNTKDYEIYKEKQTEVLKINSGQIKFL